MKPECIHKLRLHWQFPYCVSNKRLHCQNFVLLVNRWNWNQWVQNNIFICILNTCVTWKYGLQPFIAAIEMIRHPAAYDVTSPTSALDGTSVITPPLRSLIRDTPTEGYYVELINWYTFSQWAASMSVQSNYTPRTSGIQGLHPYTIFADGRLWKMTSESRRVSSWCGPKQATIYGTNLIA